MRMKSLYVLAFIVSAFACTEALLKCYDCKTSIGWGSCARQEQLCSVNQERCIKVFVKVGKNKSFTRKCARKSECDKQTSYHCKSGTESTCEINCCRTDLCNAGSSCGRNLLVLAGALIIFLLFH